MDNPVDHIVDLGLVNYVKHPTNPDYIIYRFADEDRADSFEAALTKEEIWFEKDADKKHTAKYILFGIHKRDFNRASQLNYEVEAKHKKPFIPFKAFRYFMLLFSAVAITLAIIGYCEQQKELSLHNNPDHSVNSDN